MAEITASMVKELREKSGAGMMDCKKALNECGGNMDEAMEFLRKNGQAKADLKLKHILMVLLNLKSGRMKMIKTGLSRSLMRRVI